MMKVTFPKDYRKWLTLDEFEKAKEIIALYKKGGDFEEETVEDWAEYAVNEALKTNPYDQYAGYYDYFCEVITAKAEISKNNRAYNAFGNDSGILDISITTLARTSKGYIEVIAYLSDIWQSGGTPYQNREVIRYYPRKEE